MHTHGLSKEGGVILGRMVGTEPFFWWATFFGFFLAIHICSVNANWITFQCLRVY